MFNIELPARGGVRWKMEQKTDFDVREYNSVVLAALLHDVGKFLHRGGQEYTGSHQEAGEQFLLTQEKKLHSRDVDMELVRLLVKHHHSLKKEFLASSDVAGLSRQATERRWRLLRVVKRADCYSCAERDIAEPRNRDSGRKKPLDSVFGNVTLDPTATELLRSMRYHVKPLEPLGAFPSSIEGLPTGQVAAMVKHFEDDLPDFQGLSFNDAVTSWLAHLEKFAWAIPSDTRYETSDVSLFDHLKSTAAIAACLFLRHQSFIREGGQMPLTNEIYLVGGDFSGIQDYIFDIADLGASKRLRGRSLFISLFCETTVHRVLHSLELPLLCNVFSAGGKFLLMVPHVEGIEDELNRIRADIEKEMAESFFGRFAFLLAWMPVIWKWRDAFGVNSFYKRAEVLFHSLEAQKAGKHRSHLTGGAASKWEPKAFMAEALYQAYTGDSDCKVCRKGPGIRIDDEEEPTTLVCPVCYQDRHVVGSSITSARYIVYRRGAGAMKSKKAVLIFGGATENNWYSAEMAAALPADGGWYLIQRLEDPTSNVLPTTRRYIANHVPRTAVGQTLTFEEIAEEGLWQKSGEANGALYGAKMLGILKADVDNLGLIFNKGFEKPRKEEERFKPSDRKTVSRFLTLSRMLELFFSGWMKEIMAEDHSRKVIEALGAMKGIQVDRLSEYLNSSVCRFDTIYTVYSGGDDLVLVGPWETMIIFSVYLNQEFRRYTCYNPCVSLSAGLAVVKPQYPIRSAIKQADDLLNRSKAAGKNRLTLFSTTVEWERLPELMDFFLFLNEKYSDSEAKRINASFLYRLLGYHRMALDFMDRDRIEGLKYMSALNYDIGRNIVEWDKEGKIVSGEEEYDYLQCLINRKPRKDSLIYNLKIPLFWTLYRNRKSIY